MIRLVAERHAQESCLAQRLKELLVLTQTNNKSLVRYREHFKRALLARTGIQHHFHTLRLTETRLLEIKGEGRFVARVACKR